MNFLFGLRALAICCFFYFGPTSCKPRKSNYEEEMHEHLLYFTEDDEKDILFLAIAAASSGKTVFKPNTLSDDCIRTSRVIMELYEKPSTQSKIINYLDPTISEVVQHKRNTSVDGLVRLFCDKLKNPSKESSSIIPDFDEKKKAVTVPSPEKNFILDESSDENSLERVKSSFPLNDPQVAKLPVVWSIHAFVFAGHLFGIQEEPFSLSRAIWNMYSTTTKGNRDTMDDIFTKALNDHVNKLVTENIILDDDLDKVDIEHFALEFLKKVDKDFLGNKSLKNEYSKLREKYGLKNAVNGATDLVPATSTIMICISVIGYVLFTN